MAPSLTSNSFLLSSTPQSRLTLKAPRLAVLAKGSGPFSSFQLGKAKDNPEDGQAKDSGNSSPFRFNFGNLPDVKTLVPVVTNPSTRLSFGNVRRKDPNTVYVAGATGQAGIRIAQTLLRQGFSVRTGVPELAAAQELAQLAAQYKIISNEESKRLNAVESTFEDAESIAKAIGNASKVVVTIGPGENGPSSAVSASDAVQVIQAAQLAGVGHVVIVYDGNAGNASTYNVLDGITSFFSNLFSQSQPLSLPEFLQKVIETDVSYTFLKTTLTEDYSAEISYNVVVSAEGSVDANDYKVAKSQIASLVADVFSNTAVAENKVVEVSTSPSAPLKGVDELFSGIPEDGRRKVYSEAAAKAKAEEEAILAAEKARDAADAAKKLEEEVKKLSKQEARAATLAEEAQEKAQAAGASVEGLLSKAKELGTGLSWEKFSSQIATAVQKSSNGEQPKVQVATVRGQAKARNLPSQKANVKQATTSFLPKAQETAPKTKPKAPKPTVKEADKTEVRKVFGGLFQQETIYVDDD
ncbi:tropinone reductase-like protein [Hibiscus syriacus]|uniref:Tropinone reductase-like protein n=1 Tax=Hibiscus syriacus TaxID=106335 RepID=A0A6A2ZHP8_HIBSY|nr:protein PLASTID TRANSCRIPTIONALLY ACTIVE 16, chloroplastic-like [Hibiscus syriacus]KAE8691076.1 tropinone reductase-like protein [Hibiscus syriacus]